MWKKLGAVVAAIASASTLALVGGASAHAAPTFISEPFTYSVLSGADGYYAAGHPLTDLIGHGYHTQVGCAPDDRDHFVQIPLRTNIVNAGVITAKCHTAAEEDYASSGSTVATVSLLGGLITIKGVQSQCTFSNGQLTVGSTLLSVSISPAAHFVAQSGGHLFRGPNGSYLNLNDKLLWDAGGYSVPIELQTAPVMLGSIVLVPAQYLEIGGCWISGGSQGD